MASCIKFDAWLAANKLFIEEGDLLNALQLTLRVFEQTFKIEPTQLAELLHRKVFEKDQTSFKKDLINQTLEILDEREVKIIKDRHLSEEVKTLDILGRELKISKERVRQIEKSAMMKMKSYISNSQKKEFLF